MNESKNESNRFQVNLDNVSLAHPAAPPIPHGIKKPLAAKHPSPAAAPASALLKAEKLAKTYGGKSVVNGLSIHVGKGEVVGLLGPNGAGKTTAFYMTIGLIKPDAGQVFFKGKEITGLPIHERAKMGMGYLAQEPSVFRNLTV